MKLVRTQQLLLIFRCAAPQEPFENHLIFMIKNVSLEYNLTTWLHNIYRNSFYKLSRMYLWYITMQQSCKIFIEIYPANNPKGAEHRNI
jgi:hypothetical protein